MGGAYAGVYRWVDEEGVTHYTQTPPINEEATLLDEPTEPARSSDEAWKELNDRRLQQEDVDEDRELAAKKEAERRKAAENKRIREQNCQAAKSNLTNLEGGRATRRVKTESGDYIRLTEEDHQQRLEQARKNIEEFCD
jgi:phage-related minor tail protein